MPRAKPYQAKSLTGAQTRVRQQQKLLRHYDRILGEAMQREKIAKNERRLMAMLAAEGPAFDNPLVAMAAKEIRDRILREDCKLAPDGKPLPENQSTGEPPVPPKP